MLFALSLLLQAQPFVPNVRPALEVRRAPAPIAIDGDLTDAGWAGAARAVNFTETSPREQARPEAETEAWVTYDDRQLYVAIVARDPDPDAIRSSLADRDAMYQDDYAGILLDTYGDGSWGYRLFANPRGIQGDQRFAQGRGEDSRFDLVYHSQGRRTAEGYVIEMAIPFASLRFPDRKAQAWRVNFWRNRPRSSEQDISWAATQRGDPCRPCQWGTLTGLDGIKPGGALELIPSAVATQATALRDEDAPELGLDDGRIDKQLSLTAKYSFTSGLTAEAALNPDFSQVESDAARVNVNSTFALSYPERRPFFQEGGELFGSNLNLVYTRNINDPVAAAKLINRTGRTSVAWLGARDDHSPILIPMEERSYTARGGRSLSNILRVRRTFGRNSYLGAVLTDRRLAGGGGGSVVGVDGTIGFGKVYQFEFQYAGTRTREPDDPGLTTGVDTVTFDRGRHTARFDGESFSGYAQNFSLERNARTWNFDVDYYARSPTFRAENGFETRNNQRRLAMFQGLTFYPRESIIERVQPRVFMQRSWNFEGQRTGEFAQLGLEVQSRAQTELRLELSRSGERFRGTEFKGLDQLQVRLETTLNAAVNLELGWERGERIARNIAVPAVGIGTDIEASATIRPSSFVSLHPSLEYSELTVGGVEAFSGYIFRTRASVQFTRALFLRLVVEHDGFDRSLSVEPLLTYRASPFTLMYIGSTRGYREYQGPTGWTRTETQYFAKVQYLLRR